MCGSTPRHDLGSTTASSVSHCVCALDLGSLQARGLYIFLAVNIATHRMTFSPPPENTASLGVQCLRRWLAVRSLGNRVYVLPGPGQSIVNAT